MQTSSPLTRLRAYLRDIALDGVVVPRFDPYQGEVVAAHDERLAYLTGFRGSAGIALVTQDRAVLFVDGRYQVQVKQEVDLGLFEIAHFFDDPIDDWLRRIGRADMRIGVNTGLVPGNLFDRLGTALTAAGGELVPLERDPIDAIWADQPPPPLGPISVFPIAHAGESSASKRERLAERLVSAGADLLVETQPDNIAWLLNVRGSDIAHTPLPHSTLILASDGQVDWFVDRRKLPNDMADIDGAGLAIHEPEAFLPAVSRRSAQKSVLVDPGFSPVSVRMAIEQSDGHPLLQISPVTVVKAVKNEVELDGFRRCHVADGVAVTEFMAWLDAEVPQRHRAGRPITELEAQSALLDFRRAGADFVDQSFGPISAASSNAAMCHYASSPVTDTAIDLDKPYLIDSGGQYPGGTTDITRTLAFGRVSAEIERAFTAVLKGFVALASARFPVGTCGHHLDALARRPLWDLGLDYDHGTGHGVGHFLSVHEHPHRFGKVVNPYPFEPGVVMTIEPGYYAEGAFGLRVENQVEVVQAGPGFLAFSPLTLAPIELSMLDKSALAASEIAWLNAYHASVAAPLRDRLTARGRTYLDRLTQPLL